MMALDQACLRGRKDLRVDHVSLAIYPGELLVLLGPNGSGKSSVLKLLSGELPCDSGRAMLGTTDIRKLSAHTLAMHRAVLPQESTLAFNFKVRDVVLMGRSSHAGCGDAIDQQVVSWAMELTGVDALSNHDYMSLSGGERQRVHLARILAQLGPESKGDRYLLLDEPTAALDITHQHLVLTMARNLAKTLKIGVLAIVHDLNLAALYANRIAFMKQGRLQATGLPQDTMTPALIDRVFDTTASVIPHPHRPERSLVITGW